MARDIAWAWLSWAYKQTQESTPMALAFWDSWTKMYICWTTNGTVYQYTLTEAYNVLTASYASKSYSPTESTDTTWVCFSADWTKMYVTMWWTDDIYQYTLSTARDVSTATYSTKSLSTTWESITWWTSWQISSDWTKVYILNTANDKIYQYTLSTPRDLSTWSYASKSFTTSTQETSPLGFVLSWDWTKLYLTWSSWDDINQYSLWTAWDISTASYEKVYAPWFWELFPASLAISSDGLRIYMLGYWIDTVQQFSLVWDDLLCYVWANESNTSSVSTSMSCNLPTWIADNDIMFAVVVLYNTTSYVIDEIPAWRTELASYTSNSDKYYLYSKLASWESAGYSRGVSWDTKMRISIMAYRNWFNTSDIVDVVSNTWYRTSNTSVIAAWMNITNNDSYVIFFWNIFTTNTATFTLDWWVKCNDSGNVTSDVYNCSMFKVLDSWATWDITATASWTFTTKHAFMVALNPSTTPVATFTPVIVQF